MIFLPDQSLAATALMSTSSSLATASRGPPRVPVQSWRERGGRPGIDRATAGSRRVTRDVGSIYWPASGFDPGSILRRASSQGLEGVDKLQGGGGHGDIKPRLKFNTRACIVFKRQVTGNIKARALRWHILRCTRIHVPFSLSIFSQRKQL